MTERLCLPYLHPCLKTAAQDVSVITPEVRAIWADMVDTMDAMPGYGLAASAAGAGGPSSVAGSQSNS